MAGELLAYSGIITKTKAMGATLLTEEDFQKIVSFTSVQDIIAFLKESKAYSQIFKDMDTTNVHRGQIEHELIHSLHMNYAKLYRFAGVKQRKAIRILFYKFEVHVLKMCLQGISRKEEIVDLSIFREFFERHSDIDLDRIMNCESIDAFIEELKGTDYYKILKEVQAVTEPTMFDYETRLDIYYYQKIWSLKDKVLTKKENKAYSNVIGQQIDLLNIIWIYRFKSYFNTDNGKIMKSIIPIHYHLNKKLVADMVSCENVSELSELIKGSYYSRFFENELIDKEVVEHVYREYIYKIYRKSSRDFSMSIIPIQFFLFLKEREMDRLTTAVECVRYGLPAEKSMHILKKL